MQYGVQNHKVQNKNKAEYYHKIKLSFETLLVSTWINCQENLKTHNTSVVCRGLIGGSI